MAAKNRGATVIHVDPRFTRTSALADVHVPIRAGSDIAFLGGLVRYVLENRRYFRDYVVHYTNAAALVHEDFRDPDDLDGMFSGWNPEKGKYDIGSWQYEGLEDVVPAAGHKEIFAEPGAHHGGRRRGERMTLAARDETLEHPRCVFQLLRRHFARYTPELVERACGVPPALFERVAEAICRNSGRERTTAFAYSVGWTQHSVGVQYIRTAAILQLLLGNIGRPGGGILALRGHASIQGSTDIPTLYNLLPGYLPMPHADHARNLAEYVEGTAAATGLWSQFDRYAVSLLKAWFGGAATRENDFLFDRLPRLTGDHSHATTVADMADGKLHGYFVMGENPAVGSANAGLQRKGLRNVKWLVVRDLALTETAEFWRTSPEHDRGEVRPEDIATEVFFFPAAAHTEKDGTFTNTQRLLQFHHRAVEPPGDARSDLHFVYHLGRRLQRRYAASTETRDIAIRDLAWELPTSGPLEEPSAEAILREIGGVRIADGTPLESYEALAADGSTACGCWIYSGCYRDGVNQPARRRPGQEQTVVAPEWGWAWPKNIRLLYNRASADPDGRPWSERKRYVAWDPARQRWTGPDVPDFPVGLEPTYRPPRGAQGMAAIGGSSPFVIQPDGKGWLFAPSGLVDGPLPTHYEPEESVIENPLYRQQCNPVRKEYRRRDNPYHRAVDRRFPYVLTTFRVTEHHTAGGMSRTLSWLAELQPEAFCEISPELAAEKGIHNGDAVTLRTERAAIGCRALVTRRIAPLRLDGRVVHQIGVPYHWGAVGRIRGGAANELFSLVLDPNVQIPESKVLSVDLVPGLAGVPGPLPGPAAGPARDLPGVGQKTPQPLQEP
jgi:formate dehydrogenase major subunit